MRFAQLEIGHEGEEAGEVLEGVGRGGGIGDDAREELVVGAILVAHGAVVLVDELAVDCGCGGDGLEGGEVGGEGVALGVGAGEGRHDAVVHEGEAGEHGAGGGGIPLALGDEVMDAAVAVGGVAGLALDAEDLVADGDLVVGGDGALVDPGSRVEDADGVEVVDGEASVAGHGGGVERVVVEIIFDDEGLAHVFADELKGVHRAEGDEADDEGEDQVHAAGGEEGEEHEEEGDGEEAPGEEGVVGGGGHGAAGAEEERGGDLWMYHQPKGMRARREGMVQGRPSERCGL